MLPGALRVAREHRLAGQQHDNLCGPYWVGTLLRAFSAAEATTEEVAVLAGSILPTGDPATFVPRGAEPRQDYAIELPMAARAEDAGTAAGGLIEAVARASGGARALVPLRAEWTPEAVWALVGMCGDNPGWEAVPVCNVRTGRLWGGRPSLADVLAYLAGNDVAGPSPDWDVGHFCSLAGWVEGPARGMVLVRDSYPALGWDAHYLQPAEALAAALERGDGREGGVLLFVRTEDQTDAERVAKERDFRVQPWDNGTPWPPATPPSEGGEG